MLAAVALVALAWTPEPPTRMAILFKLRPPLAHGLLGTDAFGRDVLSMLMAGARNSLGVALVAVALGGSAGTLLGVGVAARRGLVDGLVMRGCDVAFAFPPIVSAMMLGALLGPGLVEGGTALMGAPAPAYAAVFLVQALLFLLSARLVAVPAPAGAPDVARDADLAPVSA